jgi:UDP-N-acetylmuramate--alanine ligase
MLIHFIGIGGIGVSSLSRYYLSKGHEVSGSDLDTSEIIESLKKAGAKITIGPHQAKNLAKGTDKVIYSVATLADNPELEKAKEKGIEIQSYPQALGELTKEHFTIAISGAHGKGTTTAFVSLALIEAGLDPTVIIGTNLKEFNNSNFRPGKSQYLVIEADEYQKAFLNYWPKILVVTNLDEEHLDCYKDLEEITATFAQFASHLEENGLLILNEDDKNAHVFKDKISKRHFRIQTYSVHQSEGEKLKKILKIPGEHNVSNALAALAVARDLEIKDDVSFFAFSQYQGAWRRFEVKDVVFGSKPLTVISDYAHHPTEIKATLGGVREKFPKRKIWAVFQPHQYQRTYYLFDKFVDAFTSADEIVLTEIYGVAGREKKEIMEKVSSRKLAEAIKEKGVSVHFIEDYEKIPEFLRRRVEANDIVVIMGAGSIYKIVDNFN